MEKKVLVTKSSLPPLEEYIEKIKPMWDSHWLTNNGSIYVEFQEKLKKYLGCENIELYVNGHMALDVAIKALQLKGEVITTPFTFASTTHALVMNGITPVFCDIRRDNFTIDETKIENLITDKTSAIVAVHVYGQLCNMEKLAEIAQKHHLKLIFDAAHAFGVTLDGKSVAAFGDISMFSFHATKVFHSIEGGALIYQDKSYESSLKNLKNFGIEGPESVVSIGLNAKMNEFSAAMGCCNLDYLEENIEKRKNIVSCYLKLLKNINGIETINYEQNKEKNIKDNYAYFPIIIHEQLTGFTRDELFDALEKNQIFSRKYFYPLITDFECYKGRFSDSSLPIANYVSERVLTLPIYPDLEEADIVRICNIISNMQK